MSLFTIQIACDCETLNPVTQLARMTTQNGNSEKDNTKSINERRPYLKKSNLLLLRLTLSLNDMSRRHPYRQASGATPPPQQQLATAVPCRRLLRVGGGCF